ncbi:MAG: hypothetical protein WCK35_29875, partial [Chloroflexota bacterium]
IIYLLCGVKAARITLQEEPEATNLARVGRSAGLRLWLTSTVLNILLAVVMGFASLGLSIIGGTVYLCFTPLHALGSALLGWLGGWLYEQYVRRVNAN